MTPTESPQETTAELLADGWCEYCADPWTTAGCYYCLGGDCRCPCEPKPDAAEMEMREAFGAPTKPGDGPQPAVIVAGAGHVDPGGE